MKTVVGLGAGGHAKITIDALLLTGEYHICGLVDPKPELIGTTVLGVPVLGGDDQLTRLYAEGVRFAFVGVASLSDTRANKRVFDQARSLGFKVINVIHPKAIISSSARIGCGNRIFAGAVINPDAVVGNNVIINALADVEHDCRIEDHAQLSPGVYLAGNVHVGEGSIVGIGATVIQGVHIGRHAMIGAGAVVIEDVPDGATVVGVPARPIRGGSLPRVS